MSEPVANPAEYYKMTEAWLSAKDLRGSEPHAGAVEVDDRDEGPAVDLDDPSEHGGPDEELGYYDELDGDESLDQDASQEALHADQHAETSTAGGEVMLDDTALPADESSDGYVDEQPDSADPPRFNKRIAVGFVGATVLTGVLAAGAMLAMRSGPHTAATDHLAPAPGRSSASTPLAAPTSTATPEGTDPPVPYTATAVGCLPGSTAAQSAAGADPTQAWVCVTGGNVGQYVRLNLGRTMIITAACVAPGWVGKDASGADQWHQHRVLTRVQWSFNDSPPTVVPKDTGSVHGDACQPMPNHGVLASTVLMLVQETGRAPADVAASTPTPTVDGGPVGQILGTPAEPAPSGDPAAPPDQSHTDVADNSFASSSITLFGHPPQ